MSIKLGQWMAAARLLLKQGLPALAVYAMLLQAFLGAAAPASAAFDPASTPICSGLDAHSQGPGDDKAPAGRHGCICIAACAHMGHAGAPADASPALTTRDITKVSTTRPATRKILVRVATSPALGARAPPVA